MKPQSVFALGVGSFTPVLLDLALACGYEIAGLYHYAPGRSGQQVRGYPVLGTFAELWQSSLGGRKFMLTMGANHLRLDLAERIAAAGGQLPTLIHPQAQVSLWADLSPCGVYVLPCSCIQAGAVIDACCIINEQAVICHDSHLARGCFIAAQCVIGARTSVGAGVCMGLGAMCIPDKVHHIGPAARIAARALLTRDVPAGAFMMGAPAREMPYPPPAPDLHHRRS